MSAVGAHSGNSGRTSAGKLGTAGIAGTEGPTILGQAPTKEDKPQGSLLAKSCCRCDFGHNLQTTMY